MKEKQKEQITTSVRLPTATFERVKKTADISMLANTSALISLEIKEPAEKRLRQKRFSIKIRSGIEAKIDYRAIIYLTLFNLLHEVFIG